MTAHTAVSPLSRVCISSMQSKWVYIWKLECNMLLCNWGFLFWIRNKVICKHLKCLSILRYFGKKRAHWFMTFCDGEKKKCRYYRKLTGRAERGRGWGIASSPAQQQQRWWQSIFMISIFFSHFILSVTRICTFDNQQLSTLFLKMIKINVHNLNSIFRTFSSFKISEAQIFPHHF